MARQKRDEMSRDTDRAHPGSATAVRNAKGLMEIQMADVRPDITRAAESDLRIHVRAVHVDLAAMRMHDLAHPPHALFKDTVCRGIGDHQGR